MCIGSPTRHNSDIFVTTDEPTLTQHNHSKSIVCIKVILGVVHSVDSDKCIMTFIHHTLHTRVVSLPALKNLLHFASQPSLLANHW